MKRIRRLTKREKKVEVEARLCPFCGAVILFDDTNLAAYHQGVTCKKWNEFCAANGGTRLSNRVL